MRNAELIWRQAILLIGVSMFFGFSTAVAQRDKKRIVEIEVVASNRAPVATQQRWMKLLNDVGAARVRSSSSFSGAKVKVSETETSVAIHVKVQGAIQNEKLILPGKTFAIRDKEKLRNYIQQLKADGADVALAEKKAFGLTSRQLVDVNAALSSTLEMKTQGKTAADVIRSLGGKLKLAIQMDSAAKRAFDNGELIADEMDGLSLGTAISAMIRPLGLVMVPKRIRGEIVLQIVDYRSVDEHWPIGWPSESFPKNLLPSLFGKFPIEIRGFPLDQALNAIQARSKVTMIFDYNSMARAGIDLSKTKVTFSKQASYAHALGKLLNQTRPRMKYEIRLDETGQAFLWITTSAPVR